MKRDDEQRRREDEERSASHAGRVRTLFGFERDIALAAYDGEAAAEAIMVMAESLYADQVGDRRKTLIAEGNSLDEFGDRRGSNVYLIAAIAVRHATLRLAAIRDEMTRSRSSDPQSHSSFSLRASARLTAASRRIH